MNSKRPLLAKLDGRQVLGQHPGVEHTKRCDYTTQRQREKRALEHHECLCRRVRVLQQSQNLGNALYVQGDRRIHDKQVEELVVEVPYAVEHPWAVVVHAQDISAERATKVRAIRFKLPLLAAIAPAAIRALPLDGLEAWPHGELRRTAVNAAPRIGHPARVSDHASVVGDRGKRERGFVGHCRQGKGSQADGRGVEAGERCARARHH
mmetsp:Transcript_79789/g.230631  ORF Transcript_79789/g.230631 Transcript_79789/m.230631 type:complete len:208 (+) Transcript_79789:568-1191(+)